MKGKHVPIFVWTCLRHEALAKLAVTAGVAGYFEKSNGTHKTLIDAIVRAAAEKGSPDVNPPSHG